MLLAFVMMSMSNFIFSMDLNIVDPKIKLSSLKLWIPGKMSSFYYGNSEDGSSNSFDNISPITVTANMEEVKDAKRQSIAVVAAVVKNQIHQNSKDVIDRSKSGNQYEDSFIHTYLGESDFYYQSNIVQETAEMRDERYHRQMSPRGSCIKPSQYK